MCPHQFEVDEASSLNIHLNSFSFGNSALYDVKYSTAVTITIDETSPHYLFRINLEGHCQVEHEKNSGNVVTWHYDSNASAYSKPYHDQSPLSQYYS